VAVSCVLTAYDEGADITRIRRVSLDIVERVGAVTAFTYPDSFLSRQGKIVAPGTFCCVNAKARAVVEFHVRQDNRRCQTVVVVAIITGARPLAATVEWKANASAGSGCHQGRSIGGDVMAIAHVIHDIAMTGYAITPLRSRRRMVGAGGMAHDAISLHIEGVTMAVQARVRGVKQMVAVRDTAVVTNTAVVRCQVADRDVGLTEGLVDRRGGNVCPDRAGKSQRHAGDGNRE
jgi:hypothetical protein